MKKNHLLLLFTLILFSKVNGQQSGSSIVKEQYNEGKFLIRIITVGSNGYGYEILDGQEVIARQDSRSYFLIPTPFLKIDNVKIVVKWHTSQINEHGERKLNLTIERAKQLGVSKEDLTISIVNNN